ncbi:DUF3078 domain-containing protein [Marinoscillum sp. MHG1-6]|uniref:DUF3078 domain-containing protein n=1 Tax=Marinoscillum sp. MHG1-6 TaxID=2959627 RepID=UPI0021578B64|nr:DUF3078 domain-containing protein [Marinoscillum sp. MHG1-6]
MKLKLLTITILTLLSCQLLAQDDSTKYWTSGGFGSLTFSQVTLKNWAGGGQPSVSINGVMNAFADYSKGRLKWENSLDLAYGLIRQGNNGSLVKSDDKINLVTKFGYKILNDNEKWFYSGLLDFRTQFAKGFVENETTGKLDSVISRFMAPAYLTIGLGVDYKPSSVLSINYIPLTGKFTFVNDQTLADAGAYGVPDGSKARGEFGSYFRIKYHDDIMKNVNLDSRLELFSNYVKDFGTIDVNWQNALVMKVNKFLTANFYSQMIYDKDIRQNKDKNGNGIVEPSEMKAKLQFKTVIGLGLSYSIGATKE